MINLSSKLQYLCLTVYMFFHLFRDYKNPDSLDIEMNGGDDKETAIDIIPTKPVRKGKKKTWIRRHRPIAIWPSVKPWTPLISPNIVSV